MFKLQGLVQRVPDGDAHLVNAQLAENNCQPFTTHLTSHLMLLLHKHVFQTLFLSLMCHFFITIEVTNVQPMTHSRASES